MVPAGEKVTGAVPNAVSNSRSIRHFKINRATEEPAKPKQQNMLIFSGPFEQVPARLGFSGGKDLEISAKER